MIRVLDVENSVTELEGDKLDMGPFEAGNFLVSVGFCSIVDGTIKDDFYGFFKHNEKDIDSKPTAQALQAALDDTTLLVGHNLKHDLAWLLESGFTYSGKCYDTMIGEYVLARGQKMSFSLADSAVRRGCSEKKKDLTADYLKNGYGFQDIPMEIVEEYGRQDVQTTAELFLAQQKLYAEEANRILRPTMDMMNDFLSVLTSIERNGIFIDMYALEAVEKEFKAEQQELTGKVQEIVARVMGDTPINLGSPEQLSWVVYSRKVRDKKDWAKTFNIGTDDRGKALRRPKMNNAEFVRNVRNKTEVLQRTRAVHCEKCSGSGKYYKIKQNGEPFARPFKCPACGGGGFTYEPTGKVAGLMLSPSTIMDVSTGGFATDKLTIAALLPQAYKKGNTDAIEFLTAIVRLNALDVYLNSFVNGIKRNVKRVGTIGYILHPKFNQCVTATGRLSSSDPNFQNQPRGSTFPIRRAIATRFRQVPREEVIANIVRLYQKEEQEARIAALGDADAFDGCVIESDYAQLEFRAAGQLSGDAQIILDVRDGVDVHSFTATTLTDAGQTTNRQGAKTHTFKPLYGGTSGTEAEMAYYRAFAEKYSGVTEWHTRLQNEAIAKKTVTLPTGRQYAFPFAKRTRWGGASGATQIKNYPVQGFATADIVPMAVIRLQRAFERAQLLSLIANTVHDSIVVDCYPGELDKVCELLKEAMLGVVDEMKVRYGIEFILPLEIEIKYGPNWLDTQKYGVFSTNDERKAA